MATINFFEGDKIKLDDLGDGLSRKVLAYNDNLMCCEVYFEEGTVAAQHNHPHEQITYVITGEFEFLVGGVTRVLKAGDSMYKQPDLMHGGKCLKKGMLLDVFTPCRKDFL